MFLSDFASSHLTWLYSIVGLLLLLAVTRVVRSRKSRLQDVPGPFLARYANAWLLCGTNRGQATKRGHVRLVSPSHVTLRILLSRCRNQADRSMSIRDEETHRKYRRPITHAYSVSSLKGYEPQMDETLNALVQALDRRTEKKKLTNMGEWPHYRMLTITTKS
jgi:cytochrome P450